MMCKTSACGAGPGCVWKGAGGIWLKAGGGGCSRMTECTLRRVPAAGPAAACSDLSHCQQTSRGDHPSSRLGRPHLPVLPSWQLAPGLPALPLLSHSLFLHGTTALWWQHQRVSTTLCVPYDCACRYTQKDDDAKHNMQAAQCNPNQNSVRYALRGYILQPGCSCMSHQMHEFCVVAATCYITSNKLFSF